jgi:hypothetical protein
VDKFRCIRARCRRAPVVKYNADGPVPDWPAPKNWRGWLCQKHRDELENIFQTKLRELRARTMQEPCRE